MIGRLSPSPGSIRADPVGDGRPNCLPLGRHPNGLTLDPARVVRAVEFPPSAVQEAAVENPMALGIAARGQGHVGGERRRREGGLQPIGSDPLLFQPREGASGDAIGIVVPHAVEGNQNHDRLLGSREEGRTAEHREKQGEESGPPGTSRGARTSGRKMKFSRGPRGGRQRRNRAGRTSSSGTFGSRRGGSRSRPVARAFGG